MSKKTLVASIALSVLFVASVAPCAFAKSADPIRIAGPATAMLDPGQSLWRSVDRKVAREIVDRLQQETQRGSVWTETMFGTLAVATAELHELDAEGRMTDSNRREIAALTALVVVDRIVELHPEQLPVVGASMSRATGQPSPVERMCDCDKRGSVACGCNVYQTGAGSCEYKVLCPTLRGAACSAVNVELCVAETVLGIFTATE
jgi:hypothetical protein